MQTGKDVNFYSDENLKLLLFGFLRVRKFSRSLFFLFRLRYLFFKIIFETGPLRVTYILTRRGKAMRIAKPASSCPLIARNIILY